MKLQQGNLPKFGIFPNYCIFALTEYFKTSVHNL